MVGIFDGWLVGCVCFVLVWFDVLVMRRFVCLIE